MEKCLRFRPSLAVVDIPLRSMSGIRTVTAICSYDEDQMQLRPISTTYVLRPLIASVGRVAQVPIHKSGCPRSLAFGDLGFMYDGVPTTMTTAAICASREFAWSPSFYRGEQYDSDLGLYYLRARYYNPVTGRFLNVDPFAGQGQRRYQYAAADPVNGMDPSGNFVIESYRPLMAPLTVHLPPFSWCQVQGELKGKKITESLPFCPVPPRPKGTHRHPPCGQPFFVDAFAFTLDMNATYDDSSTGISRCARYVTEALVEGGANVQRLENAYQYGPQILQAGFVAVQEVPAGQIEPPSSYSRQAGDVAVFDKVLANPATGFKGHLSGHIEGFDGNKWVSDHFQLHYDPYAHPETSGHSTIYRSRCPEF